MSAAYDVKLSTGAERDLTAIHAYLRDHAGADVADQLLDRVLSAVDALESFPDRGPIPPELQRLGITRYRQQSMKPYRILYRVEQATVRILLIADGRRDLTTLLEQRLLGS